MVTANLSLTTEIDKQIAARQRIQETLADAFPSVEAQFTPAMRPPGMNIMILWSGFVNRTIEERRALVWKALEARNSPEDIEMIFLFHTLTPDEDRSIREDF